MVEQKDLPPPKKGLVTRRRFLSRLAAAAALIAAPFLGQGKASAAESSEPTGTTPEATGKEKIPANKNEIIDQIVQANDLIPRDELWEKWKIKVIDSDMVTLDFRKSIIKYDPLFKAQERRKGAVKIVLIDGWVYPNNLTENQRNQLTEEEIAAFDRELKKGILIGKRYYTDPKNVEQKTKEYHQNLKALDEDLRPGRIGQNRHDLMLDVLKYQYKPFLEGPTDEDCVRDVPGMTVLVNEKNPNSDRLIILPVNGNPKKTFEKNGEVYILETNDLPINAPRPEDSFPDPHKLDMDFKSELYAIKNPSLITITYHEMAHAAGMGHPEADLEPYNRQVYAYNLAKQGNYDGSGLFYRHKINGVMIG